MAKTYDYRPDYAVSPGSVLAERLTAHRLSQAELARRCGRSAKLISEIVAGKAPLEPKTALQLERVLGVRAHIWLGIESEYRLHQARLAEEKEARGSLNWTQGFPVREMTERRLISPATGKQRVSELLSFFGVASVQAWEERYRKMAVAYRHSPSFKSKLPALAAWLRAVEIRAFEQDCADCDLSAFKESLTSIRRLTRSSLDHALPESQAFCNASGVALVVEKPFSGMRLSGAAWWPSARSAVIGLTARHKTDDQLWFSMFHEAAHVLIHRKRDVFIDGQSGNDCSMERGANRWATDFLIPRPAWERFVGQGDFSRNTVRGFADEQAIAPGIVVGRLQHENRLPWNSNLNSLKVKLAWRDESTRP